MKPCPYRSRHWFTYYGWVGSSAPECRACKEPNPNYDRDRDPYAKSSESHGSDEVTP